MTVDMSKNRLVKFGYDPRIRPGDRWLFFRKVIWDISLDEIISDLNSLISAVESLEKGYPNILKSMREDLDKLKVVSVKVRRDREAEETARRNWVPTYYDPLLLDRPQKGRVRLITG